MARRGFLSRACSSRRSTPRRKSLCPQFRVSVKDLGDSWGPTTLPLEHKTGSVDIEVYASGSETKVVAVDLLGFLSALEGFQETSRVRVMGEDQGAITLVELQERRNDDSQAYRSTSRGRSSACQK